MSMSQQALAQIQQGRINVGIEFNHLDSLNSCLQKGAQQNFDFICIPLVSTECEDKVFDSNLVQRLRAFTDGNILKESSHWNLSSVGKVSPLFLDSENVELRNASEKLFSEELSWACHLSLPAVLLPTPQYYCFNYARVLHKFLNRVQFMTFWVQLPLALPESSEKEVVFSPSGRDMGDPWEWWNCFRCTVDNASRCFVALELTETLPDKSLIDRWLGEPICVVIVPTRIFLTNSRGYPCLSKAHQELVLKLFRLEVQFIIRGDVETEDLSCYHEYLRFLKQRKFSTTAQDSIEKPYLDFLQAPLQPLMDNLESATYETFERDPVKYTKYQEAVYKCLKEEFDPAQPVTIMVVGAGRGPLVQRSLVAAQDAGFTKAKVVAVEKNANAVVNLHDLKRHEGWTDEQMEIVAGDMRFYQPAQLADILVSELLGSFADNELSPECLDGAQRLLKPGGICIPSSYTSYLAPLSSHKIFNAVKAYDSLKNFETPYVVKVHNAMRLAESQKVFTFSHPNPDADPASGKTPDNTRFTRLLFEVQDSVLVHGFVGYFDCELYKDVHISIDPHNETEGMFSWFPIVFPLRVPVYVSEGGKVEVELWRCCSPTKVWYEWQLTSPVVTPIHNPEGRSYGIGI